MTTTAQRKKNEQRIHELASSRHEFTAADIDVLIDQLQEVKAYLTTMHPLGEMNLMIAVRLAVAELNGVLFMAKLTKSSEEKELANDLPDPPRSKSASP